MKGFCVKCNRGRGKGKWKPIDLDDIIEKTLDTKRGKVVMIEGICPKCGSKVTKIKGKVK